jgi:hypothetical protein
MSSKEYATVQIDKKIKDQIVDHCDKTGLRIGRFVERLYTEFVSGSMVKPTTAVSGSL